MKSIVDNCYTYYTDSTQEELNLMNSILDGVKLDNKKDLLSTIDKVLELPINKQIHFVHAVLDKLYTLSSDTEENKNIESFLANKSFDKHRHTIMCFVSNPEKLKMYEKKLGIRLVDSNE